MDHAPTTAAGELKRHWQTLLGATLGAAFGAAAIPFYTAGLFIVHLHAEFGWTRTELTAISMATTLLMALVAPFAGAVFDRIGVRWAVAIGYAALVANFIYMSRLPGSLAQYAVIHIVMAVFALGAGPIALTRPVNMAFDRMRGLALGITIGGIGAMAAISPPIVGGWIETLGWRGAYGAIAVVMLLAAPVVLALLSWRRPTLQTARAPAAAGERLKAPVRTWLFWRLMLGFLLVAVAVAGFVTHFVPMLTDDGMPAMEAAQVAGLLGLAVLVGRLGIGYLLDHIFAPYVATGVLLLTATGMALLAIGGPTFAVPGAIAVGLAMGAEVDLIAYLTARYYGMRRYSQMYGLFYAAFLIGTGSSPYIISLIQAAAASYVPALWLSVSLLTVSAALFLTAPRFGPEAQGEPAPAGP